jgi:hypothetical protein
MKSLGNNDIVSRQVSENVLHSAAEAWDDVRAVRGSATRCATASLHHERDTARRLCTCSTNAKHRVFQNTLS